MVPTESDESENTTSNIDGHHNTTVLTKIMDNDKNNNNITGDIHISPVILKFNQNLKYIFFPCYSVNKYNSCLYTKGHSWVTLKEIITNCNRTIVLLKEHKRHFLFTWVHL